MAIEKKEIKSLKEKIKRLEKEKEEILQDRVKFRNHFKSRLQWWIKLLGEQKHPEMKWLIEDEAKFLNTVEQWYWW